VTRLAVPKQVADDALAYARKYRDESRSMHLFGMDVTVWHPENVSRLLQNLYKTQVVVGGAYGLQNVINKAREGNPDADQALRVCYSAARHENLNVPPALQNYVDEFNLRGGPPKRRRERRASTNALTDIVIVSLVAVLHRKFGIPPTRRRNADHTNSGCDVAALVWSEAPWVNRQFSYDRVEKLWTEHGWYFDRLHLSAAPVSMSGIK
jgi:hypothetical protein